MARSRASRLAAGVLAGGVLLSIPTVAFADTTTTTTTAVSSPRCTTANFAAAQALVEKDLANRVTQLSSLISRVNGAGELTSSDKATLLQDLTVTELPAVQALVAKAPTETTCSGLIADAKSAVFGYRVYEVMTPQVDLVIVADTESAIIAKVQAVYPTVTAAIAAAQVAGRNVTAAQATFADLQTQVTAASTAVDGVSATVLAQTPAGAPGNWGTFKGAHVSVSNARVDLHSAAQDIGALISDLR